MTIKHKIILPMFEFVERQMQTKTGRTAVIALLGLGAAYYQGQIGGHEAIGSAFVALQTMFLRDTKAKEAQEARKEAKRVYPGGSSIKEE